MTGDDTVTGGALRRVRAVLWDHGLLLSAALGVGILLAMVLFADLDAVVSAVSSIRLVTVAVVLALVTVGYGIRFLKWEYYLREIGIDVPLGASLLTFFSGLMMVVTPGKAGEVWKAWFLRDREDVPANRTVAVVGAERVTDLLALTALAFLGVLLYERSAAVLLAVSAVLAVPVGLLRWRSASHAILDRCGALPVVGGHAASLREAYDDAYALFRLRPLAVALSLSVVAWGLEGIALYVVLVDLGVPATPVVGAFTFGLGSVVGAISFLPGGLAAAEASMTGVLVTLGYPRSVAVSATILIRAATLWYGALVGSAVFSLHRVQLWTHGSERETT